MNRFCDAIMEQGTRASREIVNGECDSIHNSVLMPSNHHSADK